MSANFSCYGEKTIQTPNVDRLAKEGTRFANAFTTAPVCSPCRSGLITGMFQTTIGSHHHRSGRGVEKIHLPEGVTPVPVLFQKAGYYTCIGGGLIGGAKAGGKKPKKEGALGKTDYNFEYNPKIYDGPDWAPRKPGQPFFMQVQLGGGKLRGGSDANAKSLLERAKAEFGSATDPEKVTLPPPVPLAVRPEERTAYSQHQAYIKDSLGAFVPTAAQVYLADSSSACVTSGPTTCSSSADAVVVSTAYGATGVANNLLPTSTTKGPGTGTGAAG